MEWFDDVVKPWKLARWPHHPVLWMLNNCGTKHQSVRLQDRASVVSIEIGLGPANWTSKWQPFGTGIGKMWKELMLTRCPWAKVDSASGCFFSSRRVGVAPLHSSILLVASSVRHHLRTPHKRRATFTITRAARTIRVWILGPHLNDHPSRMALSAVVISMALEAEAL